MAKRVIHSFLEISWQRFVREYPAEQTGIQRDEYGTYAYIFVRNGKRYFFCAKGSQNGIEVSCHEKLVYDAARSDWQIIMMIGKEPYRFFPYDILRSKPRKNFYHNAPMLNFSLTLGKRLDAIGARRAEPDWNQPGLFAPEERRRELPAGDR